MWRQPTQPLTPAGWAVLAWLVILATVAIGVLLLYVSGNPDPDKAELAGQLRSAGICFVVGGVALGALLVVVRRWLLR